MYICLLHEQISSFVLGPISFFVKKLNTFVAMRKFPQEQEKQEKERHTEKEIHKEKEK